MKWTILFLVVFGVAAAICTVLLVNAFRADSVLQARRGEVSVVVMARDLPAWSEIHAEDLSLSKMKKEDAPMGYYPNTALVVGKSLSTDMVEGQILTQSEIQAKGGPEDIASRLRPGMRAVSVTVSRDQISGGLLYKECFVDVLASFQLRGGRGENVKGEALSTTLLERVKVLAIAGVLNTNEEEGEKTVRPGSGRLTVTLELDSDQAEALQVAVNNGSISLALRNPLDTLAVNPEATILDRGRMSALGTLLGTKVGPAVPTGAATDGSNGSNATTAMDPTNGPQLPERAMDPSYWNVTVIRGSKVLEEQLPDKEPDDL